MLAKSRAILAAVLSVTALTALSAYTERPARANGRFPRAQTILTGDGGRIILRATFGLMTSSDHGAKFDWVCEQSMGFTGAWDPPLGLVNDVLYLGLSDGLRTTKDGCGFTDVAELEGQLVSDLSVERGTVWLSTSTPKAPAFVWRARAGAHFEKLGKGIAGIYIDTLDVEHVAEPTRIYATGVEVGKPVAPHFFRSDDGGKSFRELHPAWPSEGRLFIADVDAGHRDRVLVRTLGVKGSDLLLSEDGGSTFRVVLHFDGAMFGFARSSHVVWAGSGTATEGLFKSSDDGATFAKVRDEVVYCLHADGTTLYACSEAYAPNGYAIAASTDEGRTFRTLAGFSDVRGPVACVSGDGIKCSEPWPQVKLALDAKVSTTSEPVDAALDAAPLTSEPSASSTAHSRCGCSVVGADEGSRPFAIELVGILLALIVLHRRGSRGVHRRCPSTPVSDVDLQPKTP
ncbi:hypothetical protein BH09MYX1_BH09MYX1_27960 [soil metagenome]